MGRDAHAEALERLGEHLEALVRLTDIEDVGEITDERALRRAACRGTLRGARSEGRGLPRVLARDW